MPDINLSWQPDCEPDEPQTWLEQGVGKGAYAMTSY